MEIEETHHNFENGNRNSEDGGKSKNYENYEINEESDNHYGNKKEKIFILTKIKRHKNWTKEEDKLLIDVANKFKQKSWTKVALYFKDKNPAQCRARYKRIRPGIVKGAWTKEEDQMIIDLVNSSGRNWALISKMMPTRNGKQIRDRFLNYLDPHINKIKFTDDDDKKIIEYYKIYGTKWSKIAKFFEGRTGDMIKNRFYSCLKRKVHIYEVNTNKRIRKKYYKAKRLAIGSASSNLTSFNPGSSAFSKASASQNLSKLECPSNSLKKSISNKIIINTINGKNKNFKEEDDLILDHIRNKENKSKPPKNIFKAVREEKFNNNYLEPKDFEMKNEENSELKENMNKLSHMGEFNNFSDVKNNYIPKMGINNHINFLINASNTSGMNSMTALPSNMTTTPFQMENYCSENLTPSTVNTFVEAYYNLLAASGGNPSNMNVEPSVNEVIAKNLENLNNFNILTLSKILNFKSQLEGGMMGNPYNNQNNYSNNSMNNFYNMCNVQRMMQNNQFMNPSSFGGMNPSQSEMLYLMGLNYQNLQINTMSNSSQSSNRSTPN
jgi:hypothetical protein